MFDEKKLEQAFSDFDAKMQAGGTQAISVNVCGTWHSIKGTVDAIISGLRAIGTLFPIAKKAADVLDTLRNLLNSLCP